MMLKRRFNKAVTQENTQPANHEARPSPVSLCGGLIPSDRCKQLAEITSLNQVLSFKGIMETPTDSSHITILVRIL